MNFFKTKTTWSNAEFIWLKLAIGSAYLLIGTYFHDFFESYYLVIFAVFAVTVIRALFLWLKKMETERNRRP